MEIIKESQITEVVYDDDEYFRLKEYNKPVEWYYYDDDKNRQKVGALSSDLERMYKNLRWL